MRKKRKTLTLLVICALIINTFFMSIGSAYENHEKGIEPEPLEQIDCNSSVDVEFEEKIDQSNINDATVVDNEVNIEEENKKDSNEKDNNEKDGIENDCSAPRCQDTISKILSYIFLPSFVSF